MPPRSRKSKAALAAAAACKQYQVGDLVLAKVKGFPAWPATVSEPKKWGHSHDWKKVFVHFFGTNQIAFCNPADIEAFTEAKKESLVVKRQNRGADFVRAVKEIVECYEKLKNQNEGDANNGVEIVAENGDKSLNPLDGSEKDHNEATSGEAILKSNCSDSIRSPTEDDGLPPKAVDTSVDRDALLEEIAIDTLKSESPSGNSCSMRKRSVGNHSQAHATQRKFSPVKNSNISSRSKSDRINNLKLQSRDGGINARNGTSRLLPDRSSRRTRRSRGSPSCSDGCNGASAAFVSNGSIEDDGSEVATLDSDTISLNGGSTLESGCVLEPTETSNCLKKEVDLDKTLNLETRGVVIKKRRKPNRKRVISDPVPIDSSDKGPDSLVDVHKTRLNSPSACDRSNERHFSEDGDEHLPLVKRARVRMGKHLDAREQPHDFRVSEKTTNEVFSVGLVLTSLNSEDGTRDGDSLMSKESPVRSSPSDCSQFQDCKLPKSNGLKNNIYCAVDGEAVLPPSKRLHRALEAMSANAAEICHQAGDQILNSKNPGAYCTSPPGEYPSMLESNNVLGVPKVSPDGNYDTEDNKNGLSLQSNPMILKEPEDNMICDNSVESKKTTTVKVENAESMVKNLSDYPLPPVVDEKHSSPVINKDRSQVPGKDGGEVENIGLSCSHEQDIKELVSSDFAIVTTSQDSSVDKRSEPTNENDAKVLCNNKESGDDDKLAKPSFVDNNHANGVCKFGAQVEQESSQDSEKCIIDTIEGSHVLSHCSSVSEDLLGGQTVSSMQSRPSPNHGMDLPAQFTPSEASLCPSVITVNSGSVFTNGSCSRDAPLHQKKDGSNFDTHLAKPDLTAEAGAKLTNFTDSKSALASFATIIGTLIRTKESIGRATRAAFDCAKVGVAGKVVDILARNLETEQSLPRRVDLFFLVDSIMQYSRGFKGEFGGLYPSAIQAALPRLLSAAAPPGNTAQDNRRQCLKVLRLWLERKIFPESVICHHIRILDSLSSSSSSGPFSRRSCRNERAFDDPLREMEGMLVDEYGSNSSFQLAGFRMPRMLKDEDEGSDSDGGNFEAVTPEHTTGTPEEQETTTPMVERHRHILEDVDGELEMEDVAPVCAVEMISTAHVTDTSTVLASQPEQTFLSCLAPPLPNDMRPYSPPLPRSPPPAPLPAPVAVLGSLANGLDMSSNNPKCSSQSYALQPSIAPVPRPPFMDPLHYHGSEQQEFQMGMPDSSCSFSNVAVSHPSMQPVNGAAPADGPNFHNNVYPLRPPHPTPSNQFSYVHADQPAPSWREPPPPPYPNRYNCRPNTDGGHYFTDHDKNNFGPYDFSEDCRYSGPSFSGPRFPDHPRGRFAPPPYLGPHAGIPPSQRWGLPAQEVNHRNAMPLRPLSEGPWFWRPR